MSSADAHVLARLMHQVGPAYLRWAQQAVPPDGLSAPRMQVLGHLGRTGAAPLHEIRDCLGSSAANVTKLVDALEADGLVRRRPDPGDRRVIQVEITDEGREASCGVWERYEDQVAALFDRMSEPARQELQRGFESMLVALKQPARPTHSASSYPA